MKTIKTQTTVMLEKDDLEQMRKGQVKIQCQCGNELTLELNETEDKGEHECPFCDRKHVSRDALTNHLQRYHKKERSGKWKCKCRKPPLRFFTKERYMTHVRVVHGGVKR